MARSSGRKTERESRAVVPQDDGPIEDAVILPPREPRPRRPRKTIPLEESPPPRRSPRGLLARGMLGLLVLVLGTVALFGAVDPPTTPYMLSEGRRLGGVDQAWVPLEDIAPVMARAAVAAEDAEFCNHWGLDLDAIRQAAEEGSARGASTISQQVVKNVFLWQGRSWTRKAVEAALTPVMEAFWSKRRILEVYLNVAEFGEGVFGVEAAAHHWFGVRASELTEVQAARLAAILPDPKHRDPADPTDSLRARARGILDGAATIAADGRASCFQRPSAP
ncbi:monofunctional biosynthetic peptidoglycan transglycosylase [Rubellimicrobium roseum]|uniref:Biosynthetic peptidoglycan transglycosylase n=1 Tax=Rubellimicrobium roseum TaxID=687525 RepID=A0A5C4NJ75_9RHOB|nr:monofunctional biosynthetic peptidoglycan transglycosylase [Rubellimicrobium roseum]TNC72459.1 monofunctional biosynthetic peptidoglycan transglycosylase [Rubellimicrobium roseum]